MLTKTLAVTSALSVLGLLLLIQQGQTQRENLAKLSEEFAAGEREIRQTQAERGRITTEISAAQASIESIAFETKHPGDDTALSQWLARVERLKQWLKANPEKRIPEMMFLTSNDWLSATLDITLDTDAKIRNALSKLRATAKQKPAVSRNLMAALPKYYKVTGQPLSDPDQLSSYLNPALPKEILQRYEVVSEIPRVNDHTTVTTPEGMRMVGSGRIVLKEKAPVDEDYDTWIVYTEKGSASTGTVSAIGKMVTQAERAFNKANHEQVVTAAEQLLPYFQQPVDQTRLKEYWAATH